MINFKLIKNTCAIFSQNNYIGNFNIIIINDNGSVTPFTSLLCEYKHKANNNIYTISCHSLKTNKIMMDMFGDIQLSYNNKQSFKKTIKKIIEKYFEN